MSGRSAVIERTGHTQYDVIVVGGGIAGAGVARDAALRGLDVLLVERRDFGWGTTAASTRLIHGGLRYLEHLEFDLVYESLRERERLAEIAPHLVSPCPFIIPQYDESVLSRIKLRLGMLLYDVLSYWKTMPRHRRLSRETLLDLEDALPKSGLQGGFLYHDRQCEFVERLCLETVLDAVNEGADVLNHTEVTGIRTTNGEVVGVTLRDTLAATTLEATGQTVVNTTGPWADDLPSMNGERPLVRPAKGIHLVTPSLTDYAVTLPTTDGRVIFIVPWDGKSLVGTTDTDFEGNPAHAVATAADVEYLLEEVERYGITLELEDILYTYAGVRPLYNPGTGRDSAAISRQHRVVDHGDAVDGLFTLVGAKITTYRQASEDMTDSVVAYLDIDEPCRTATKPLPGARGYTTPAPHVSESTLDHLTALYGSRRDAVFAHIDRDGRLAEPLCTHTEDVLAQVTVAVEEELARRLTDVLFRRCTVGWAACEGRDAVETVADHMAELLDWNADRRREEVARYEAVLNRRHAFSVG